MGAIVYGIFTVQCNGRVQCYCCFYLHTLMYNVSVLGQEEGYMVKYTPSPKGVPKVTPECEVVYLTVYSKSSPNMDSISF